MDIQFIIQIVFLVLFFTSFAITHYHLLHIYKELSENNKELDTTNKTNKERTQFVIDAIDNKNEYASLIEDYDRFFYKFLDWGRYIGILFLCIHVLSGF